MKIFKARVPTLRPSIFAALQYIVCQTAIFAKEKEINNKSFSSNTLMYFNLNKNVLLLQ